MLKPLCDQMCGVPFSDLKKSSDGTDRSFPPLSFPCGALRQSVPSFPLCKEGG